MRTTIFDGRRYCTSHCERLLPLDAFYRNGDGDPNTQCKACRRIEQRERQRQLYQSYSGRRTAKRARSRAFYAANAEAINGRRRTAWRQRRAAA